MSAFYLPIKKPGGAFSQAERWHDEQISTMAVREAHGLGQRQEGKERLSHLRAVDRLLPGAFEL